MGGAFSYLQMLCLASFYELQLQITVTLQHNTFEERWVQDDLLMVAAKKDLLSRTLQCEKSRASDALHKAVTPYFLVSCPLLKWARNEQGMKYPTFSSS